MNTLSDITDGEFVPFLQNLGVDTCKSFDWMLNDPDFAGVLRWIYNSLDHNNALTAREEYRYHEIKKKGSILSSEDLENTISSIQDQYPGICLPGDQEYREDVELDVLIQEERLHVLEKQEIIVHDLIKQNEAIKDQLTLEVTKLNAALHQCEEDETKAAEQCTVLAKEVETLTDELIVAVADNLDVYASCKGNKDLSQRFIAFSPLDTYQQSQALLQSHHELFVSKNFGNQLNKVNDELKMAVMEAKNMEERLLTAALAYVKSKADLNGEQAKLALISNYNRVHPSQISTLQVEASSAMELLEREEAICAGETQHAVERLVQGETQRAKGAAVAAARATRNKKVVAISKSVMELLEREVAICAGETQHAVERLVRGQTQRVQGAAVAATRASWQSIHTSLSHLVDVWQRAYALDRILYYSLRHELRTLEEFVQFAAELRQYAVEEGTAVATRIEATNEIILEQATCSQKTTNSLLQTLASILQVQDTDPVVLVKAHNNLQRALKELRDNIQDGYMKKEKAVLDFKTSCQPLRDYVWGGCTKQAHCWDLVVSSLSHSLRQQIERVDKRVLDATDMFTRVKNGDTQNLRKLWQWFLTDETRFLTAVKNCTF